jgi:hypothetical protein
LRLSPKRPERRTTLRAGKWPHAVPAWFMSVIVTAVATGIAVWLARQMLV